MIVFFNTTPIIALSSINQLNLLPTWFNEIYVVAEVVEECLEGGKIFNTVELDKCGSIAKYGDKPLFKRTR